MTHSDATFEKTGRSAKPLYGPKKIVLRDFMESGYAAARRVGSGTNRHADRAWRRIGRWSK